MKWSVRSKLAFAFAAVLAVLAALAVHGAARDRRIEERIDALQERGVLATRHLGTAAALLHRIRGRSFYHLATRTPGDKAQIEHDVEGFERDLDAALGRAEQTFDASDPRRVAVGRVRDVIHEYIAVRNREVFPPSRRGDNEAALTAAITTVAPYYERAMRELDTLLDLNVRQSEAVYADARGTIEQARVVSLWGTLFALAVASLAAWLLSRSIAERIGSLARVARSVRDGNLSERTDVGGTDEISELARAFDEMTAEVSRRIDAEKLAAEGKEKERAALAATVRAYGGFVDRVARGELTARIDSIGGAEEGDLAALRDNLGAMAKSLRTMTLRTHEAVGALATATAEILTTTQEHSASAAESAAAVTETVATVEEVAQTARLAAERARAVASASQRSVAVSDAGRDAAERAVSAMTEVKDQVSAIAQRILALSEQAQAVGQIIATVNELAEQSNLVALNAAIEAARAGEAGRAFAVVATEIRALAERSKRATGDVRVILGDVQKSTTAAVLATEEGSRAVTQAVDRVRETGKSFGELADVIAESADAATHILDATEQQASGVTQISQAMQSIKEAASQTVEGTRQTERAARDLNELSAKLRDAVAQYRVT